MDRDLHLIVRSDPRLLSSIRSLVRSWVESWDVDEKTTSDVVLAIDEACTNAIRHAYGGREDCSVTVGLQAYRVPFAVRHNRCRYLRYAGCPSHRPRLRVKQHDRHARSTLRVYAR